LRTIKGKAGATSKGTDGRNTSLTKYLSTHTTKETWDLLPLSKACNLYYEHSGARQHKQQQNPLDVGIFLPEPI
jgi:hypothetical protein